MSEKASDAHPDEGEGRTEDESVSAPHDNDKQNGSKDASSDHAEERSGESEIPIGTPMTADEWRQAKEQAERADPGD